MENKLIEHTASIGDLYRRFDKGELSYEIFDARLRFLEKQLGDYITEMAQPVDGYKRGYQAGYHTGIRKKTESPNDHQ